MFIGRERELQTLEQLFYSDHFEFAVIYGRRRVGKTALISHFIQDKDAIYFMGVESSEKQNLENLSKSIMEYSSGIEVETSFLSFQAALEYVFRLAEKKRVILAIDEYPYVARASKSLASTLQLLIDKYKESSKLMLILCGSSMSYMEDQVLAYKAPLYGRRTAQMKMFLTRIGFGSKVVITGDASQKDLAPGTQSGLDVAVKVLSGLDDIGFCNLTSRDVVRHPLVQKIVKAYETYEAKQAYRESKERRLTSAAAGKTAGKTKRRTEAPLRRNEKERRS